MASATIPVVAPPLIAGIDYSTVALDVALVRGRQLISIETYRLGADLDVQVGVISRLMSSLCSKDVAVVVMEERWARVEKGLPTAMKIRDVSTRVETLAAVAGLETVWVPVNKWHMHILGNGGLRSEAAKQASLIYAERVYGLKDVSHNQADAICIATWGAVTALQRALATA